MVFNSAAIYRGKCLNDTLSTGPPLLNKLPPVIIKFREGEIGFTAEIEAMFSRIRMRPEDARYHRFIWRDKDMGERKTFQMNRLSFGDCCSPFIAVYATRTAGEFGKGKPEAVYAIQKKLYMDYYLDSGRNAEEAINRAREVQAILGKGDFHLTKWLSNSRKFNEEFQPDSGGGDAATERPLGEEEAAKKVLGLLKTRRRYNHLWERRSGSEKDPPEYHRGDIRPTRTYLIVCESARLLLFLKFIQIICLHVFGALLGICSELCCCHLRRNYHHMAISKTFKTLG